MIATKTQSSNLRWGWVGRSPRQHQPASSLCLFLGKIVAAVKKSIKYTSLPRWIGIPVSHQPNTAKPTKIELLLAIFSAYNTCRGESCERPNAEKCAAFAQLS